MKKDILPISQRVSEHGRYVDELLAVSNMYKRIGTFLVGSQNYGIATEDSDVDTISICAPTLETAALAKHQFIGTTYILENGEHAVVKDIRDYIADGLFKQNINFVETLFTEYFDFVPEWK